MAVNGNGEAAEPFVSADSDEESPLQMWQRTLSSHLGRIRRRLVAAVLFFLMFSILGFVISQGVLQALTTGHPESISLVFLGPTEAFVTRIKLALALGFIGAFPFLIGQIWSFASPFMAPRQRKAAFALIPLSYVLFLAGVAVAYRGVLPLALRFLLGFRSEQLTPMLSVSPYISFVIFLVLPMAMVFQMPVVVMFLARIGVLKPHALAERRKYAVLLFFTVGAILTPPDVFSQILLAVPLIILFEISLLFARLAAPREPEDREESTP